jgi:membrane protease YdiL (CAAX protease family)
MLKKIFTFDAAYNQMNTAYSKKDAAIAVSFYFLVMLMYLFAGFVQVTWEILLNVYVNLLSMAICIVIVLARGQKLDTIGFTLNRFLRAIIVGIIWGAAMAMLNIIPAIISGGKWTGFNYLLWNVFFYLIVIGLQEELVFRGFILTRLHGAIKSEAVITILCGFMFAMMHIPYQLYIRTGGNVAEFFGDNYFWLLTTFAWHFLFYGLYRKYNSLTAPTLCHFLMNFSNTLFG